MDNHQLIECIKRYPCIYDQNNEYYSKAAEKTAAWRQVSKEMNKTLQQCKKKWIYLRDAFRRSLKKRRECKNNRSSVSPRKWKYENEMSFMLPCFKESNFNSSETDTYSECDIVENAETNEYEVDVNKENEQCVQHQPRNRKPKKYGKDFSRIFMEYLLQNNILASHKNNAPDDVRYFFDSITSTVKGFTPYNRAIAKAKVSSIISELEIRNLSQLKSAPPLAQTRPITPFPQQLPMVSPGMMMPTSENQNMPMSPVPQSMPMSPAPQIRLPCSFPTNH